MGAPATAVRGGALRPDRATAIALAVAAVGAVAWLIVQPHTADMAAQVFRSQYFADHGFQTWNPQWYGGHHLLPYSVLSPVIGGLIGIWLAGAIACVLATSALARVAVLAGKGDAQAATIAAVLLALGCLSALWCGRVTYLMGVAGAAACFATLVGDRDWWWWAPLAILTACLSPVAALFLALIAFARLDFAGITVAVLAMLPVGVIAALSGNGGWQPYSWKAFLPVVVACSVALTLVPAERRAVRIAIALYLALNVGVFIFQTPIGANAARLGPLCAGALAATVLLPDRKRVFWVLLPFALVWQLWAPVVDNMRASGDRSTQQAFYAPLIAQLKSHSGPPSRVEVVWTRGHWEAAWVARSFPLARGWERQLDNERNAVVNGPTVSAAAYRKWLDRLAVRWVAIPNHAPIDSQAAGEAKLVRSGLPWLREVWKSPDWTLYEVERARLLEPEHP